MVVLLLIAKPIGKSIKAKDKKPHGWKNFLVGHSVVLLGGVLESANGGIETIGLSLQALHLLSDGVHLLPVKNKTLITYNKSI